jgi:predicted lactoylglutathione lyase
MRREQIKVMFVASYFDVSKVKRVADKTGARPVVVALAVEGQDDMKTYFDQFDIWIGSLTKAFAELEG